MRIVLTDAYQDGAQFYSSATGNLLASYPHLVRNDYDMIGARIARMQFANDFPMYCQLYAMPDTCAAAKGLDA